MKIGIVGSGMVGATAAYAMVMRGIGREIVLVDKDKKRAEAEAYDISHAIPFACPLNVRSGNYQDLRDSRLVIIGAGVSQHALLGRPMDPAGPTRLRRGPSPCSSVCHVTYCKTRARFPLCHYMALGRGGGSSGTRRAEVREAQDAGHASGIATTAGHRTSSFAIRSNAASPIERVAAIASDPLSSGTT